MQLFRSVKGYFFGSNQSSQENSSAIKLLSKLDKEKTVAAVIVTFCKGASYDELFNKVEQASQNGTQVLVYSCTSNSIEFIQKAFNAKDADRSGEPNQYDKLVGHINSVDPDCVVFNWQCCAAYIDSKFSEGSTNVMIFVRHMIDRGHMVMFSDFSLKALISEWNEKILGPNPFIKINDYQDEQFELFFDCQKLRDCPSAQLQIIGEMASKGKCNVKSMPGTIVYGIKNVKPEDREYNLEVLTICSSININKNYRCKIGKKEGAAGHVILTYKSGGSILTSMGHWIELMKIDTSEKALFEVVRREYGEHRYQEMRMKYDEMQQNQKMNYLTSQAANFVQNHAPCENMAKKRARKAL